MPPKKSNPPNPGGQGAPTKYTEEVMEKYARDILEWAKKEDSLILRQWLGDNGFDYAWLWEMCEKFPMFSKAYENARVIIGSRRELMCMHGKLNSTIVSKTMHNYDRELLKTERELKKIEKDNEKKDPTVVHIINYSDAKVEKD